MKKTFTKFLAALALLAFFIPSMTAWATDVTFSYSDYTGQGGPSGSGSEYTMVKTDVSISDTKFYGNTSFVNLYAGGVSTITPASGVTITEIVLTASAAGYNGFQSGGTVTPSTGSVSAEGTAVTWTGSANAAFTISHNKQIRWTSIVVTYTTSGGGQQLTPTTTTITAPQNFNDDLYVGTTAGTLTASVTYDNNGTATNVPDATVTWASTDQNVATVDNSGAVTLVAVGTTNITATYTGDQTYAGSMGTYQLTVVDNTPSTGTDVTFTAGTETGTSTGQNPDTMTKDGVTVSSTNAALATAQYRLYSGSTTTISVAAGYTITKIIFNGDNTSYPVNRLSVVSGSTGNYSTNNNVGIWTGDASSVAFYADGQARAASIVVTIESTGSTPTISATPSTLNTFSYLSTSTDPSAAQSVSVSGANLTDDITVSVGANSNFEISTTENGTYSNNNITLSQSSGTVTATSIWVRMKSGLTGSPTGTLTLSSTGATSVTISLNGEVVVPMTVAEAITAIDNASNNQVSGAYVAGIISQVDSYDSEHNSITYWISDDGTTTTQLEVYSGKGLNGASFNGISDLGVGDQVVVYGDLKIYNNVYEFNYNNYLVSYTAHQAQTYDLTVNALTNVEMFVFDANDQSQSLIEGGATAQTAQVLDGTSILVRVSATQGYGLATFTVDGVDHLADINSSDEYTFTMPGHDVTITATAQPVYTISFYVNGTIDSTLEKTIPQSNNATLGDLPTPAAASVPTGYQFCGWMVKPANVYYNATTAPTMVNASTAVSGNMNLAAVFAQTDISNLTTGELTATEIAAEFASSAQAYNDAEVEYEDGDFTWAARCQTNANRHWIQLRQNDVPSYIKIVAPGSIRSVDVTITSSSNSSGGIDDITMHTDFSSDGNIYLNTEANSDTHVGTTSGSAVMNDETTIVPSGDHMTLYLQVSKAARIWGVTVSCGQVTYINYTTLVATFQTEIAQYTSGQNDGWYLIASPVMENITPVAGNGFITSAYDLYRFNPTAEKEWENWKSNENESSHYHFSIETGRGYLYASSSNTTLEFTGTLNTDSDVTLTYDGWNLIGNSSNATRYVSGDYYIINSTNSGIIVSERTGGYVNAMEGILVNGSASGVITFSTSAKASRSNSKVVLNVVNNNGNVIDRAIARFDESDNFEKITLAQNDTKIYFPMADADYAIVSSDGHGTMPVNFKAKEIGQYTISVETEGIDLSYLHLIDRLTGENIDLLLDSKYSFIASNSDMESRFILSFTEKGYDAHGNEIFVYQSGNDLIVNGEGELQIFDVMGRMVKNTVINGVEAIAMPQGVYIFRLNENIQKIVVR